MSSKNSMFTEEVLAAELRLAKLRIQWEQRQESVVSLAREGRRSLSAAARLRLEITLAELNAARREHFELLAKAAEETRGAAFQEAHDLWINGVAPYDDIDLYPTAEAVERHLASTRQ